LNLLWNRDELIFAGALVLFALIGGAVERVYEV
jgi:hypothetical protein